MADTHTEIICDGVSRRWLYDGRIVVFKNSTASRQAVDALLDTVATTVENWSYPAYLAYMDMSDSPWTPYGIYKYGKFLDRMPTDLEGRIAITLPSGLLGRYVQTIVRNFSVQSRFPYLTLNYFRNHDPAVAWLAESLNDKK